MSCLLLTFVFLVVEGNSKEKFEVVFGSRFNESDVSHHHFTDTRSHCIDLRFEDKL